MKSAALPLLALLTSVTACSHPSLFIKRGPDPVVDHDVTAMWSNELHTNAKNGDWLLTRAYYMTSDVIALGTGGEKLSHASIYDADRQMVIESVGSGVREIPVDKFLERNHFVIVVRPTNTTEADGRLAVARARTKIGAEFDGAGMFGFDNPDKWYCSELVFWASQTEARAGRSERVITPADLMKYGEVIYWSGMRDDDQVMQLAHDRARMQHAITRR